MILKDLKKYFEEEGVKRLAEFKKNPSPVTLKRLEKIRHTLNRINVIEQELKDGELDPESKIFGTN